MNARPIDPATRASAHTKDLVGPGLFACLLLALLIALRPFDAVAVVTGLACLAAVLFRPQLGSVLTCFVLYTNVAVVAVQFHGVPFAVAAAFPLLLIAPVAQAILFRGESLIIPPAAPFVALFLLVQALGAVFSIDPSGAKASFLESLFEGAILYFGIANAVRDVSSLRQVVWTLVVAGALISIVPILQKTTGRLDQSFGGFGQVEWPPGKKNAEGARLAGSIGEINRFAQILLMLLPFALFRSTSEPRRGLRIAALAGAACILGGIVMAFSRGAAVGLVILLLVAGSLRMIRGRHLVSLVVAGGFIIAVMPTYRDRLASIPKAVHVLQGGSAETEVDGSSRERVTIMIAAWHTFLDHPVIGVGPDSFPEHSQRYAHQLDRERLLVERPAHSLPLGLLAEHGLLGAFAFTLAVVVTMARLLRVRRMCRERGGVHEGLAAGFILAIPAYLAAGLFLHLSYARFFWCMLGLAAAADHAIERTFVDGGQA